MFVFIAELLLLGALLIFFVYYIFLLPPTYPTNIPAVPFWVALIPFFKDVDQSDIFRQYIERPLKTHGAVKLFFGSQWNILVHKPSYIAEIFKDEDLYEKSGNQKKIPHSVLAEFLGDNIISSHGEVWRNYQSVVKPGLQRNFEADKIAHNADRLCGLLKDAQLRAGKGGVPVQELLQRYSVANCSEVVLQTNLDALGSANAPINVLQSAVKREIFKPIFMNFPILDCFPFPSRSRARQMVSEFKNELRGAVVESQKHNLSGPSTTSPDGLGRRMLDAKESGLWTEQQLLDNLTVAFVAGQENPQLCMISTLYLLAKHPDAQARLHTEIQSKARDDHSCLDPEILQDMPFLTAVIYESLRLFPPIGQLVNRKTTEDALLGGAIVIPKGTYLGYNCYSTNRDAAVWGPGADVFDPGRWGASTAAVQKQYRQRRAKAEFISFHGGRRACLGEKFAMLQMRITLVSLVRESTWKLDPTWVDRKTSLPLRIAAYDGGTGQGSTRLAVPLRYRTVNVHGHGRLQRSLTLFNHNSLYPNRLNATMEFSNEGQSFYHRFQGSFLHNRDGELMHCTGPRRQWLHENWGLIKSSPQTFQDAHVKVYESVHASRHNNKTAVIVNNDLPQPGAAAFEDFFVQLILDQADLCVRSRPSPTAETDSTTQKIVDLFDSYLRYQGKNDKWTDTGRTYFAERVQHFTAQNTTIEFCLPAFPCKSSNGDKVTGPNPDRGEELALNRLHVFVEAIEQIYEPGAKLWIISDGHVFSDCIGVNDADVDAYGEKLKVMNHDVGLRRGNTDRVGFKSLVDLFQLAAFGSDERLTNLAQRLNIPTIAHHVTTDVTEEAELCRRILMAGCGPRQSAVRAKIDSKDAAITALYRGFSRFMLEDLEHHPHTQNMTRSKQKKLSSKVAFEMILMLFPNHVRLSIHAHNNAGPKFGIQLFDPAQARAVEALSPDGELMTSLDLLHIPTPWHNSVVQIAGSDVILVTKAKLVRAALAAGSMKGGLVRNEEGSAYFGLEKPEALASTEEAPGAVVASEVREPESVPTEAKKDAAVTVTVTVTVVAEEEDAPVTAPVPAPVPAPGRRQRRTTLSEKADAVVTAVVRRNTGNLSAREKPNFWLGRLKWLLSLFWPRGV
ncbi:Pyoverdine/dityrosine biosynthesis protein-domain-containing protein [Chaetomidium leptoderma]|uniref:Pyoverdine/dityrosine biosynthesis protein-domain-containing protein n=1 Tax=Chaetomidium leptoderma TaxID=669021 RepID=A0AAN6VNI4_9PEZI|nr:Pyoverdine/dityrosine biosynthesis protein-domain-containing protein [Chaetomidium leptoderma]